MNRRKLLALMAAVGPAAAISSTGIALASEAEPSIPSQGNLPPWQSSLIKDVTIRRVGTTRQYAVVTMSDGSVYYNVQALDEAIRDAYTKGWRHAELQVKRGQDQAHRDAYWEGRTDGFKVGLFRAAQGGTFEGYMKSVENSRTSQARLPRLQRLAEELRRSGSAG